MKQAQRTLLLLTTIFVLTEIIFNYLVLTEGDGDLLGATTKTFIFLILIFYSQKS